MRTAQKRSTVSALQIACNSGSRDVVVYVSDFIIYFSPTPQPHMNVTAVLSRCMQNVK